MPPEFLKDPSYWLEADKMESFLQYIVQDLGHACESSLLQEAGHASKDLRAWGVLDSVLRMMQHPRDIFAQPERLLSYFISPAPPVGKVSREDEAIDFELPVSATQFPLVVEYLRAALEALPTYAGKPMAQVRWEDCHVSIRWSVAQESLFMQEADLEPNLHPELLRNIVHDLESSQKQVEETRSLLRQRDQELAELRRQFEALQLAMSGTGANRAVPQEPQPELPLQGLSPTAREEIPAAMMAPAPAGVAVATDALQAAADAFSAPARFAMDHVYRLNDYLGRAHQLITLLVAQGRQTPQVQEAMRRVDWAYIQSQQPTIVKETVAALRDIQAQARELPALAEKRDPMQNLGARRPTNVNYLVGRAIEKVAMGLTPAIQIDSHLLLDRDVTVDPTAMEEALGHLLKSAAGTIRGRGAIRVVTRPKGARAEIEISDTGEGCEPSALEGATGGHSPLQVAQAIVRMHDGSIKMTSRRGEGSTFVVDLPF